MAKHLISLLLATVGLLAVGTIEAQVTISGTTTVTSGGTYCYSASTTCTTKKFCWSGSGLTSITPETTCSGGGPEVAVRAEVQAAALAKAAAQPEVLIPNTGGGGSSCTGPAMAQVVFPVVTHSTTAYIYITNYCSIQGTLAVTILPLPGTPVLSPATQSFTCTGTPTTLSMGTPTGGNGSFSYQWLSSPNNSSFTAIAGATVSSYTPPLPAPGTTMYYQLQLSSFGMTATSTAVSVANLVPAFAPGTITPATQGVYMGTTPPPLQASLPTGGSCGTPVYTYLWYSSTDGTNFTSTGVTTQNYTLGSALQIMYYKRFTAVSGGPSNYTNTATVTPYLPVSPGSVSGPASPITYNSTATIANTSLPVNGYCGGNYAYQWYSSTAGTLYQLVAGATGTSYTTGPLQQTTFFVRTVVCGTGGAAAVDTVRVAPALQAAVLSPTGLTIAGGASPGVLSFSPATGGNCSGSYTYAWQSSSNGTTWTTISGITGRTYSPGALTVSTSYRVIATCGTESATSNTAQIVIGAVASDWNFVRTRELSLAGVADTTTAANLTSAFDVQQNTEYFDGLGRPIQHVARQASPLQKDMVSVQVYDPFGREVTKYLPYTATAADGNYKPTAIQDLATFNSQQFPTDQFYYSEVQFESSPLNRVAATYPAGNSWVGSGRGIATQYVVNTPLDSVEQWNISFTAGSLPVNTGQYGTGLLEKTLTIDEQGHQEVEYKDKDGLLILRKVQSAATPGYAHVGWLCTYYVYDDLNNLRFVISPRATELINTFGTWTVSTAIANELCHRYEYDFRNRVIIKKVAGAGEVHMVYDERDRLVMSQDSNLRAQHEWLFTCYDGLDREDSTGLMTDPANYNNLSYHTTAAMQSATYPNLSSYTVQLLSRNFYDDYKWVAATSAPVLSAFDASHSTSGSWFITGYNASPTYAVAVTPFYNTRGMHTGTAKIVINSTSTFLYTSMFYDDRGRKIQTSSNNYGLGRDTVTTQYNFTGNILRSLHGHSRVTNAAQSHMIMTWMDYDQVRRLNHIYKLIDNPSSLQLIANMQYDELGRLNAKYLGNSLDSLIYSYNIRGWLTGINKNYVGGTTHHSFGMELAYDNPASVTGTTYTTPEYNGNIAGTSWKSSGDGTARKYDFSYDDVSRLTGADFNQSTGGTWGKSSGGSSPVTIDFSVSGLGYDANGNIQSMIQQGFKIGGTGTPIDSLTYSYIANTNKILQIHDEYNDTASVLGDFHYKGVKGSSDYAYDGNGNLIMDNNKGLNGFSYNFLNQVAGLHATDRGNISFTYDAGGNKLEKQVKDSTTGMVTFTSYLGEFQYQRRAPFSNINSGNDTLEFISTEEGRARWAFHKHVAGDTITYPEYDFVERDHLGNERVIITQERDTTQYIATMEAANRATENALFYNIGTTCVARTSVPAPGYPDDLTFTNPNDSVVKLNGNGPTVGPALILKVMSGDIVDVGSQFYYNSGTFTSSPPLSPQNLLNSLASGLATLSSAAGESLTTLSNPASSPLLAALTSSINNESGTGTTKPQAYLNWVLLDKQFRYVAGSGSGAMQVGAAGPNGTGLQPALAQTGIEMSQSGYLYIYVSNATKGWDVFFDNISVKLYTRQLLEENHYYPFGLTMAAISDKAIKPQYVENKYRFNKSSELQNKEFKDGSGLDIYETATRSYDPQIGRFWQPDPFTPFYPAWSPYSYALDNPERLNDETGLAPEDTQPKAKKKKKKHDPKVLPAAYSTKAKKKEKPAEKKPTITAAPPLYHERIKTDKTDINNREKYAHIDEVVEGFHADVTLAANLADYAEKAAMLKGAEAYERAFGKVGKGLTAVNAILDLKEGDYFGAGLDVLSFWEKYNPYVFTFNAGKQLLMSDFNESGAYNDYQVELNNVVNEAIYDEHHDLPSEAMGLRDRAQEIIKQMQIILSQVKENNGIKKKE
jgi:RHS repeat-associated protein